MLANDRMMFYILVPVYKTEKYIRKCLDSICNQTYDNFCAILVDDGSPDKAGEICDEYAKVDSRFHVIHKRNQGLISARRVAIDYVKENCHEDNAFFVFLDSDDMLHADALQIMNETICADGCDMVVYGLQRVCEGKVISLVEPQPYIGIVTDKRELYKRVFGNSVYNPLCRKAIHCACVQSEDYSQYYHISRAEDLLQCIPIYDKCRKVSFIENVLYDYTVNPGSITQTVRYESYKIDSTVRTEVWRFIKSQDVLSEDDKKDYLEYCKRLLKNELCAIACFDTSYSNIAKLYDQIKTDQYYCMLLSDSRHYVLKFVRKRWYWVLVWSLRAKQTLFKLFRLSK